MRYEDYYGFSENPFGLAPDPKYHVRAAAHASACELVTYAVRRGDPLLTLTGDSGTGKTTLCRTLAQGVDTRVLAALVLERVVSEDDLLRTLLQEFGVISRQAAPCGVLASVDTRALTYTLTCALAALWAVGAHPLAVVDDAQSIPSGVLEALGRLAMAERGPRLQVLLVGQPTLRERLRTPELRTLDQRVSMRCELKPLSRQETAAYVAHRLATAGAAGSVSFSAGALARVYGCTRGVPRLINLLCDRALVVACAARSARVLSGHVDRAAEALDLARPGRLLLAWAR